MPRPALNRGTPSRGRRCAAVLAFASLLTACSSQPAHRALNRPSQSSHPGPTMPTPDVLGPLLPLPPNQLRAATDVAVRFAALQATYRFDEPPQAYLAYLHPLTSRQLYNDLARDASTPGIDTQRTNNHLIATAQAIPVRIRAIMATSVIVVVSVHQTLTTTETRQRTDQVAITVTTDGGAWSVTSIQPAALGDAGDSTDADQQ
jgi:hypothetical protein